MLEPAGERRDGATSRLIVPVAVAASFVVFFARIWCFVSDAAVDVPYLDAWDVLAPFFTEGGVGEAMLVRHGGVLQGLGALLFALSSAVTGWDFRAHSFEILVIQLVAALLALELRVRLYGRPTLGDVVIAPIFLRMVQGAAIALAPYPACSAFPLLLLVLGCRALVVKSPARRAAALAVVALLAGFTGFSLFVPPVLAGVIALGAALALGAGRPARAALVDAIAVVAGALPAAWALGRGNVEPISCPGADPTAGEYAAWVVTMLNGSFGIFERDAGSLAVGAALFLVPACAIGVAAVVRLGRRGEAGEGEPMRLLIPLALVGFSLSFSLAASFARICAPGAALNSRYMPLMAPFALGLWFGLLAWEAKGIWARKAHASLVLIFVAVTLTGALRVASYDEEAMERSVTGKQRWIECARRGGSVEECNRRAQFEIYPSPAPRKLDERVEFLRSRELSFFREREGAGKRE